ncbi:MAG: hypothetical protein U0Y68_24240 [Blastocatellia bacterium]
MSYSVRYETRNDGGKENLETDGCAWFSHASHLTLRNNRRGVCKTASKDRDWSESNFYGSWRIVPVHASCVPETAEGTAFIATDYDEIRNQYTLAYSPSIISRKTESFAPFSSISAVLMIHVPDKVLLPGRMKRRNQRSWKGMKGEERIVHRPLPLRLSLSLTMMRKNSANPFLLMLS